MYYETFTISVICINMQNEVQPLHVLTCNALSIVLNDDSDTVLFNKIGFSAMPGAMIKIVGPNGSGKTSLLRCIVRLNNTNAGKVLYNGCDVDNHLSEYNSIICYISDKNQLNDHLTVEETLTIWSFIYDSELLLTSTVHVLGLAEYLQNKVWQLSRGWKKKLVLARLLLQKTRVWLLDEPFAYLDRQSGMTLNSMIETHVSNGGIVILSDNMDNKINLELKQVADQKDMDYIFSNMLDAKKHEAMLHVCDFKSENIKVQ